MKQLILAFAILATGAAFAEAAKLTVTFPNSEVKHFRFDNYEAKELDLGSQWSKCSAKLVEAPKALKMFELSCGPTTKDGLMLNDVARVYTVRVPCLAKGGGLFFVYDNDVKSGKKNNYSILIECK